MTIASHSQNRNYDVLMFSPSFVPLAIAAAICLVCAFAGGSMPAKFFDEWQPATVYNAVQLLLCSIVAAAITCIRTSTKRISRSTVTFWSIVSVVCALCVIDELYQLHESYGPIAASLSQFFNMSGKFIVVDGREVLSIGDFVELIFFCILGSIAWLFRKEVLAHPSAAWMFGLASLFLFSSVVLDFGMMHERHAWLDPSGVISPAIFKTVEESLKLGGIAMVLGAMMSTLLEKRQRQSVEKMLSSLQCSEPDSANSPSNAKSLV
ncbi:MAG: hypothetical protein C0507_15045 [Cyanobacteria bacterium PR.3.49]|nr:hypothetical protein [Cyanobacteria bacterium PR.3.49]